LRELTPHFESAEAPGAGSNDLPASSHAHTDYALRHALKLEAIARLTSGVAHSLNNLLTSIVGFSEILLMTNPEAQTRDAVEQIQQAGQRAVSLIAQLMSFSRGESQSRPRLLEVNGVVTGIEALLRCGAGSRIEVELNLEPTLLPVQADLQQMMQIIMTLVLRARDLGPAGGKILLRTVNASVDDSELESSRNHSWVVLSIERSWPTEGDSVENGYRSSPAKTATTQDETEKTLDAVRTLVEQFQGRVPASSTSENCVTFAVYLPAIERRQNTAPADK
jgi:two-component system, cell cycle sensor histidine kinase and response regulator CckA